MASLGKRENTSMDGPIIVTGGAGFIGSHLVNQLVERGARVRVVERPGACVQHLPVDRIDVTFADIREEDAVAAALRGAEQVYHLAANPNLWVQRRGHFGQVNFRGTVNVLEGALATGAR